QSPGGAYQHPDRPAGIVQQAALERRLDLRLAAGGTEDHVAAGDVGAYAGIALGLAHGLQLGHRQLAGTADVDRAEQGDIGRHGGLLRAELHCSAQPAQTSPRAAIDTGSPSPTTKWSSRRTSTRARACFSRAVTARS